MKIRKLLTWCLLVLSIFIQAVCTNAQTTPGEARYRNVTEVQTFLSAFQQKHPASVALHTLAASPGGRKVTLLEIGTDLKQVPAIFVGANFEGTNPLSTEGALRLAGMLMDSSVYRKNTRWFILAMPNPDASAAFFSAVKWERAANDAEVNNDTDDQLNEDGPDDLNGDGLITMMRVENPEGTWITSAKEPRLMVRADPKKGERGKYKMYPEGIDNDKDGSYNEDGPGGINVGINFPHLFTLGNKEAGLWPGETPEVYALMKFMFDHPEIVMAFTLGSSDFCLSPPRNNRTGGANMESLKIPVRYASLLGADPEKNYTMAQVLEMAKSVMGGGGREISADMIIAMLGLGAAVNPMEDDLKFYTTFSEQYKEFLKKKGFSTDRVAAPADKDGSFELWAYYHLGLPSFAMNLFTIPKPVAEKPAEGAAGNDGTSKMPAGPAPSMRNGSQAQRPADPEENNRIILGYSDKNLNGEGFVNWKPFVHPVLGKCEIGGFAPYFPSTPPAGMIDSLCRVQLPWLLQLSAKIPEIRMLPEKITSLGAGIYRVELYFENKGILSWPTAMGARNRQPAPVAIQMETKGVEFLEGFARTPLGDIGGNQVKKLSWLVKTDKKGIITVKVESPAFSVPAKQINIGG